MNQPAAITALESAMDAHETYIDEFGTFDYSPDELEAMRTASTCARDLIGFLYDSLALIRNPRVDPQDALQFVYDLRGYLR